MVVFYSAATLDEIGIETCIDQQCAAEIMGIQRGKKVDLAKYSLLLFERVQMHYYFYVSIITWP